MIRRSPHAPASEAQRQLLELGVSQRQLGAAVGVSHQTAHRWLAGIKAPRREHQEKIAAVFGIRPQLWELAPRADAEPPLTLAGDLRLACQERLEALRGAELAAAPLPDNAAALDSLLEQCRRARAQPNVAPTVLARLGALEVSATTARERLRAAVDVAFASEDWKAHCARLRAALVGALGAHPLAHVELLIAIDNWGPGGPDASKELAGIEADHAAEVRAVRDANAALVAAMRARAERITGRAA